MAEAMTVAKPPRGTNVRQEIFSLPEGTVSVEWPGNLSHESFEDLSDWLDILKRQISRAANQAKPCGARHMSPIDSDEEVIVEAVEMP